MGKFIWPGSGVTFLILLLHANYFGHPLLITCLDIFFNALLYTGIAAALRRLLHIGTNEREVLGSRADCLHCIARSSCIK